MKYASFELYNSNCIIFDTTKQICKTIIYMATQHVRKVTSSIGGNVYTLGNMPTPQQQMQQQMQQQKSIPDFESVIRKAQKVFETIVEDAADIYNIIVSEPKDLLVRNAHELCVLKNFRDSQQQLQQKSMKQFLKKK